MASEKKKPSHSATKRNWKPGDLVLHEGDPKVHSMLRKIVEVGRGKARTVFLDDHAQKKDEQNKDKWHSFESLLDPRIFLKTSEFEATSRKNKYG
jgi:hypothetical protein